jgi:RimJ/RimL family protein N-acetyltransferase
MQQQISLPDFRDSVVLLNGQQALLRPILPEDRSALADFFSRLGSETRFLRFHYTKAAISDEELRRYCECDYDSSFTLLAERGNGHGKNIVGMGTYDRLPDGGSAEVAFVVEDTEQGNGIGTYLLAELAMIGRQKRLHTFVAEIVTYNEIMLSIFRKFNPALTQKIDGDSARISFSILNHNGAPPLDLWV